MAFWFTISFITNILGPLIPDIIHNFNLSDLAMAGFIPTSFFLAYAIMSLSLIHIYELRWQLHRHKWFTPMGKAYRVSGDEKYAKEWAYQ